jgi:hypothetical protein
LHWKRQKYPRDWRLSDFFLNEGVYGRELANDLFKSSIKQQSFYIKSFLKVFLNFFLFHCDIVSFKRYDTLSTKKNIVVRYYLINKNKTFTIGSDSRYKGNIRPPPLPPEKDKNPQIENYYRRIKKNTGIFYLCASCHSACAVRVRVEHPKLRIHKAHKVFTDFLSIYNWVANEYVNKYKIRL